MSIQVKSSSSSPTLQSRFVTPSASTQYITPQSGYDGLSQVTVSGDSNLVNSNIKSGVSIFGVSGNMVSWDRPNTFNFHDNLDTYLKRGSTYFFTFKFYSNMDDAENKTNSISINISEFANSWGKLSFQLTMGDYYINWDCFFRGIDFYSSGNVKGFSDYLSYVNINHRASGLKIYDAFETGGISALYSDYIDCAIGSATLEKYGSAASVEKTLFGIRGNNVYY